MFLIFVPKKYKQLDKSKKKTKPKNRKRLTTEEIVDVKHTEGRKNKQTLNFVSYPPENQRLPNLRGWHLRIQTADQSSARPEVLGPSIVSMVGCSTFHPSGTTDLDFFYYYFSGFRRKDRNVSFTVLRWQSGTSKVMCQKFQMNNILFIYIHAGPQWLRVICGNMKSVWLFVCPLWSSECVRLVAKLWDSFKLVTY